MPTCRNCGSTFRLWEVKSKAQSGGGPGNTYVIRWEECPFCGAKREPVGQEQENDSQRARVGRPPDHFTKKAVDDYLEAVKNDLDLDRADYLKAFNSENAGAMTRAGRIPKRVTRIQFDNRLYYVWKTTRAAKSDNSENDTLKT